MRGWMLCSIKNEQFFWGAGGDAEENSEVRGQRSGVRGQGSGDSGAWCFVPGSLCFVVQVG